MLRASERPQSTPPPGEGARPLSGYGHCGPVFDLWRVFWGEGYLPMGWPLKTSHRGNLEGARCDRLVVDVNRPRCARSDTATDSWVGGHYRLYHGGAGGEMTLILLEAVNDRRLKATACNEDSNVSVD